MHLVIHFVIVLEKKYKHYLLTATIGHIILQTIQTKMPICVSYFTNTMPIFGGGGCVQPHFCQCQWKILGAIQAIFMQIF